MTCPICGIEKCANIYHDPIIASQFSKPMPKISVELQPWSTPNYVRIQEGAVYGIPLKDIDAQALSEMCDQFRKEVFEKAGKEDPRVKGWKVSQHVDNFEGSLVEKRPEYRRRGFADPVEGQN